MAKKINVIRREIENNLNANRKGLITASIIQTIFNDIVDYIEVLENKIEKLESDKPEPMEPTEPDEPKPEEPEPTEPDEPKPEEPEPTEPDVETMLELYSTLDNSNWHSIEKMPENTTRCIARFIDEINKKETFGQLISANSSGNFYMFIEEWGIKVPLIKNGDLYEQHGRIEPVYYSAPEDGVSYQNLGEGAYNYYLETDHTYNIVYSTLDKNKTDGDWYFYNDELTSFNNFYTPQKVNNIEDITMPLHYYIHETLKGIVGYATNSMGGS